MSSWQNVFGGGAVFQSKFPALMAAKTSDMSEVSEASKEFSKNSDVAKE